MPGKFYRGCWSSEELTNHQHFANIIATEEELAGGKVLKQIFDVPVIENPLQLKARDRLQFERVFLNNMVAGIQRFRSSILCMKKGQQMALGLQHDLQTFNQGLYEAFRKVVSHVPEQDGVKLISRIIKVFRKELRRVKLERAILLLHAVTFILRFSQNVFIRDAHTHFGE